MHRAVVKTNEIEKITPLPESLKKFKMLEIIITPAHSHKKIELKKRFESVFRKARNIKISKNIDIDNLMNEMNNALL